MERRTPARFALVTVPRECVTGLFVLGTEVRERSSAAAARPTECFRADYGFVATMDREVRHNLERDVGYEITDTWDERLGSGTAGDSSDYIVAGSGSAVSTCTFMSDYNMLRITSSLLFDSLHSVGLTWLEHSMSRQLVTDALTGIAFGCAGRMFPKKRDPDKIKKICRCVLRLFHGSESGRSDQRVKGKLEDTSKELLSTYNNNRQEADTLAGTFIMQEYGLKRNAIWWDLNLLDAQMHNTITLTNFYVLLSFATSDI
ncbi:hypothetical protein Tco_0471611 [Tanacetum coccineum]